MKKIKPIQWIAGLLLAAGLAYGGWYALRYYIAPSLALTEIQPETLAQQPVDMRQWKGKRIFVNYFATWCRPCVREMPMMAEVMQSMDTSKYVFVCISQEPIEKIAAFQERMQLPFRFVHSRIPFKENGVYSFPQSFIFDENGTLLSSKVGSWKSEEELRNALTEN